MKKINTDRLMIILLAVSGIIIVIGAFLKIAHVSVIGDILFKTGFLTSLFFSGIEILRLRRIIEKLKHQD